MNNSEPSPLIHTEEMRLGGRGVPVGGGNQRLKEDPSGPCALRGSVEGETMLIAAKPI